MATTRTSQAAAAAAPPRPRPMSQPRPIQHKKEAFWFYRFLSIFYDRSTRISWTEEMRGEALAQADLCDRGLRVVDVGGGTGYSTLGIVRHVDAENVTLLDQSVHQLAKARQKEALKGCTIIQGDAEDLPFPTDYADRYVSAGSTYSQKKVCGDLAWRKACLQSIDSGEAEELISPFQEEEVKEAIFSMNGNKSL